MTVPPDETVDEAVERIANGECGCRDLLPLPWMHDAGCLANSPDREDREYVRWKLRYENGEFEDGSSEED